MGKTDIGPGILILIAGVNLALLIWFIVSINSIKTELRQIAAYTRRTALSLPLTSGQAKLINRSFSPAELVAIVEKQGGRLRVVSREDDNGAIYEVLAFENQGGLDPELVSLVDFRARDVILHLKASGGREKPNDAAGSASVS